MQSSVVIPVVINASSGFGYTAERADELTKKFQSHGLNVEVTLTRNGEEIAQAVQHAIACKPRLVVAGGGDGTISAVGAALTGTGITLGVLPMGTLNHFAKDMRIPLELDAALLAIAAGGVTRIDVGNVNDRIFLNNSSLGLYPDVVRDRERQQRRLGWGKWRAFLWAIFRVLRRNSFIDVRLIINNRAVSRRVPFIFIGNNEYVMEGFSIGERRHLDDGHLGLYMARHSGRLGLLKLAALALLGRLRQTRDFDAVAVEEIEIVSRRKQLRVAIDGEVTMMDTPLRYRIVPNALTVIAPQRSEAENK
jgi:diacylglycerol kinase family enzyme